MTTKKEDIWLEKEKDVVKMVAIKFKTETPAAEKVELEIGSVQGGEKNGEKCIGVKVQSKFCYAIFVNLCIIEMLVCLFILLLFKLRVFYKENFQFLLEKTWVWVTILTVIR